jgi:hypothetical protein
MATMTGPTRPFQRSWRGFLALMLAVLALLGLRVWLSPAVLTAPHGGGTGGESIGALVILVLAYAVAGTLFLRARLGASPVERRVALERATLLGSVVGACALGAIASDTFLGPASLASVGTWSVVALAATVGWGWASLGATRAGGSWRLSLVAAMWSGMVSALVGAGGDLVGTLLALQQLARHELSNPDYLAWHQPDVQSYAIASAVALGVMGLALAPVVAGIVGIAGGWFGKASSHMSLEEPASR